MTRREPRPRLPCCCHPSACTCQRSQKPSSTGGGGSGFPESHFDAECQASFLLGRGDWRRSRGLIWDPPWANSKPLLVREQLLFQTWLFRAEFTKRPGVRGSVGVRNITVQSPLLFAGDGSSQRPVCGQAGPWSCPTPVSTSRPERGAQASGVGDLGHCHGGGHATRPAEEFQLIPVAPTPESGNSS